jgi:hypothetical protein
MKWWMSTEKGRVELIICHDSNIQHSFIWWLLDVYQRVGKYFLDAA